MKQTRIEIERRNRDIRNARVSDEARAPYYSCFAEVKSLGTKELYDAMQIGLESTIVFKVRRCRCVDGMRRIMKMLIIRYDGAEYELYAMDPDPKAPQYMLLKCKGVA